MKENVGGKDQAVRAVVGPLLMTAGLTMLGGRQGKVSGLVAMMAGAMVTETAITKTCPLNELAGIDTTH